MKRQVITGWLSVLLILVLSASSVLAGPPPQTGTKTYRNPAWVLTLSYPASWEVQQAASDVVGLSSDPSGSDGVNGVCLVSRSASYAKPDQTLDDLFTGIMNKIGGTADDYASQPADARRISGIEADAASFTAVSSSKTKLQGTIYRAIKGRYGYVIIIASSVKSWSRFQSNFNALVDSIQLGAMPPAATPARTPRTTTATPTRTPRPRVATATPVPTAETPVLTSAREAFEMALPEAEDWSVDAALSEVECLDDSMQAADMGKCREWSFRFMASEEADMLDDGYEVIVSNGELDLTQGGEDVLLLMDVLGTDWMDSPEAVQAFLDGGGQQFLEENPQAAVVDLSLYVSANGNPAWTVRATVENGTRVEFAREIDAITGEMQSPTPTATVSESSAVVPVGKTLASCVGWRSYRS